MKNTFTNGDYISCKTWGGREFLGLYEHTYNDSTHCVIDVASGRRFNIYPKDIKLANEEEIKVIKKLVKETGIKPREDVNIVKHTNEPSYKQSELDAALEATE